MHRWGILGTSFISETVAEQIIANPHSKLQAVAGRTRETLDAFAEKFSVPDCYTDYQMLIDDENVDIVYIGLPNHVHHEYLIKGLAAGKHVLCEKSLSVDMSKTQQMLEAVNQSDKVAIEGLMYVHHPLTKALSELLSSQRLGRIEHIDAQYCVDIAQFVNAQGGGVIYDLGCYPLSSVQLIMQQVFGQSMTDTAVISAQGELDSQTGNVVDASAELVFDNQVTASVKAAECYDKPPLLKIRTELATIELVSNLWMPDAEHNAIAINFHDNERETVTVESQGDAFYYQTQQVIALIENACAGQQLPYPTIDDSYRLMEWLTKWESLCKTSS